MPQLSASVTEQRRLDALYQTRLLDTPPSASFDRLTSIASRLFDVPICLVSLVDKDRQWFKSRVGLEAYETPRQVAFCDYSIRRDQVLEVPDALEDVRFKDNPLVLGEPHIRFYAGAPLRVKSGERIGTLCLIDRKPRKLSADQLQALRDLADTVEDEIELLRLLRTSNMVRKMSEDALATKERFLSSLSHDIRTPLNAINGFAEMLSLGIAKDAQQMRDYARHIEASGRLLTEMLGSALDGEKTGADSIQPETVALDDLIDETWLAIGYGRAGGAELAIDGPKPQVVSVDLLATRRIFMNLFDNAVKMQGNDCRIRVILQPQNDGGLIVSVEDNGPGYPDAVISGFGQPVSVRSAKYDGQGRGLSIVKTLCNIQGLEASISNTPDGGARFTISGFARP